MKALCGLTFQIYQRTPVQGEWIPFPVTLIQQHFPAMGDGFEIVAADIRARRVVCGTEHPATDGPAFDLGKPEWFSRVYRPGERIIQVQ